MENDLTKNSTINFIVIVLVVALIFLWFSLNKANEQIQELRNQYREAQQEVDSYQSALTEANDNIEIAADRIQDAKSNAWISYNDMGDALDELEPVDTVPEP